MLVNNNNNNNAQLDNVDANFKAKKLSLGEHLKQLLSPKEVKTELTTVYTPTAEKAEGYVKSAGIKLLKQKQEQEAVDRDLKRIKISNVKLAQIGKEISELNKAKEAAAIVAQEEAIKLNELWEQLGSM